MANLGFFELLLFGVIALIVLGPEKLPVAARTLGRWYRTFRQASARLQHEISSELQLLETQEMLKKELAQIRQSEADMKAQMDKLQQSINQSNRQATSAWREIANMADAQSATLPMTNRWFLLGEYDRKHRLPPAPFLPNHTADPLLNKAVAQEHQS
ncbi:Sec-independent protein translocase protein TatB [Moraxella cuniculi]|uniref:Sec-independent protein translocase protein TatB n=1 Tax=Moraxella cuniculi TaxID=34061 RepID=A0A448GVB4_9GAMM|nr:Sec-independent protein translocase protein TatB [Moraxella cuniculi]VEG12675.1 Sec-independent protein translocase protein TatB [Moraxella cuniculi]